MKKSKKKSKKTPEPDTVTLELGEAVAEENGRKQKRTDRRRVVNEDLQLEIATLRETVNEMLNRYKLKLDAELVQLAEAANGNGALDGTRRKLPIATAESMLKRIRSLEVKSGKGRAKDFQRVQDLVGDLIEQLPAEK